MFLIMSAAYVNQELRSQFGQLPPAFLPLGNTRLFKHQISTIPQNEKIYLTLPETYQLHCNDFQWLQAHSIELIYTSEDLSLGAALVTALNLAGNNLDAPLHILFGDTLIPSLPKGENIIAVSEIEDGYKWAVVSNACAKWLPVNNITLDNSQNVINGYFKFAEPRQLIKAITQAHWNFIEGLNIYQKHVGISTVHISNWLDFGHLNTYYRSKAKFTTQRAFNQIKVTPHFIEKTSNNYKKIKAEAHWFSRVPEMLRLYLPQYLGSSEIKGKFKYRLEYLHLAALNELFVFATLPTIIWNRILHACLDFIDACAEYSSKNNKASACLNNLLVKKTHQRLNDFCRNNKICMKKRWNYNKTLNISLEQLIIHSTAFLPNKKADLTIMHGDFCFSNIFYDFCTNRIKTIDPRGLTLDDEYSIYGDIRYDLAKLSHSILGMYDWIIAGYYFVNINGNDIEFEISGLHEHKQTQQLFIELIYQRYKLTPANLYAMQISLFLSMLPLHNDDPERQKALLANAFRLYQLMLSVKNDYNTYGGAELALL